MNIFFPQRFQENKRQFCHIFLLYPKNWKATGLLNYFIKWRKRKFFEEISFYLTSKLRFSSLFFPAWNRVNDTLELNYSMKQAYELRNIVCPWKSSFSLTFANWDFHESASGSGEVRVACWSKYIFLCGWAEGSFCSTWRQHFVESPAVRHLSSFLDYIPARALIFVDQNRLAFFDLTPFEHKHKMKFFPVTFYNFSKALIDR